MQLVGWFEDILPCKLEVILRERKPPFATSLRTSLIRSARSHPVPMISGLEVVFR